QNEYSFEILEAVTKVNAFQKQHLTNQLMRYYGGSVEGRHFALWGLAFKPDTDDIREAPALEIIKSLLSNGATVAAYDPQATPNTQAYFGKKPGLSYAQDPYEALQDADAL